jgi:hypothetical protein
MPECKTCGITQATVEMRRSPTDGWLCKEKADCKKRVKEQRARARAQKKTERMVARRGYQD